MANAFPQSLDGAYYFRAAELGDDPLDVFRDLRAGGSFYLAAADTLSEDASPSSCLRETCLAWEDNPDNLPQSFKSSEDIST